MANFSPAQCQPLQSEEFWPVTLSTSAHLTLCTYVCLFVLLRLTFSLCSIASHLQGSHVSLLLKADVKLNLAKIARVVIHLQLTVCLESRFSLANTALIAFVRPVLLGPGILTALFYLTLYLQRLHFHHIPPNETIVSVSIASSPPLAADNSSC